MRSVRDNGMTSFNLSYNTVDQESWSRERYLHVHFSFVTIVTLQAAMLVLSALMESAALEVWGTLGCERVVSGIIMLLIYHSSSHSSCQS